MITGRLAAASADAPFSDGVTVEGRLAFLAGQGPILNGAITGGSIGEQTRVTLQNVAGVLARLGADASAVVSCTCYLADLADLDAFNAAYLKFFGEHRPARTTVQAHLIGGIGVEITAVVALPPATEACR
ncbi:MAG TPA: RidA family protein [Streptosporangiaceae bacterium]|nr:RidA family protein [Streptosporangiaceae bacterium]